MNEEIRKDGEWFKNASWEREKGMGLFIILAVVYFPMFYSIHKRLRRIEEKIGLKEFI